MKRKRHMTNRELQQLVKELRSSRLNLLKVANDVHNTEEKLRDWQDIAQGYKEGSSQ